MKKIAQAIRKISISQGIPIDSILYKRDKNRYILVDTVNKEIYALQDDLLAKAQFDQENFTDVVESNLFGDVRQIVEEMFQSKFPKMLDLFSRKADKMDIGEFQEELKNLLKNKHNNMESEIEVFVDKNGRELFRKFRVKLIQNKKKLEESVGRGTKGKGKSKDSKGIYLNMPSRPASAKEILVKKSQSSGFEYIDLSCTPINEPCVQVDPDVDYVDEMKEECRRFVYQLREIFPWASSEGIDFIIKGNPHDFGEYYEVFAKCSADDEKAINLSYWIQDHLPLTWKERTPLEKPEIAEKENFDEEIYV